MQNIIFMVKENEINISKLGFDVVERVEIPTPQKKIIKQDVPGRDGSLIIEDGYDDITINIKLNIISDRLKRDLRNLKSKISGADKLILSDDPDFFYVIKNLDFENATNEVEEYSTISIKLICDPFIYSKRGSQFKQITGNFEIDGIETKPIIRLTLNGEGHFLINGNHIRVKNNSRKVYIDSILQIVYSENNNEAEMISENFPELTGGTNTIQIISGITKLEIQSNERFL